MKIKAALYNADHLEYGLVTIPFPISRDQYDDTIKMLEALDILTHCAPSSIVKKLDPDYGTDELTDFLETVRQRCRFAWWFFGHYHRNQIVDERYILQWEQISGLEF